jgi:hypothetical protein
MTYQTVVASVLRVGVDAAAIFVMINRPMRDCFGSKKRCLATTVTFSKKIALALWDNSQRHR